MKKINLSKIEGLIYKLECDFIPRIINYFFSNKKRVEVLEIGSYKGKSTLMFLTAHHGVHVTCIEPFCGPTDADAKHLYGKKFKNVFLKNTQSFRKKIRLIEKFSNDKTLFKDLRNSRFDICFIDGDHSYKSAAHDIDFCLSRLKKDGLLIFDDYWIDCGKNFKFRGVRDAVNKKLLYRYKFLFLIRSMAVFQNNRDYKHYEL